jgi:ATP-dependent Lon protease
MKSAMVQLPILTLEATVVFPHTAVPLTVERAEALLAVESAMTTDERRLFLVTTGRPAGAGSTPGAAQLATLGTEVTLRRLERPSSGRGPLRMVALGLQRARLERVVLEQPFPIAELVPCPAREDRQPDCELLAKVVHARLEELARLTPSLATPEVQQILAEARTPLQSAYAATALLTLEPARALRVLEADDAHAALERTLSLLQEELGALKLRRQLERRAEAELSREQREWLLRQQLRAIQGELGETEGDARELAQLKARLATAQLPAPVAREVERELARLERLPPLSPEQPILRARLELMLELPWAPPRPAELSLARARQVLDEDHHELEEVKTRVLEQLSVLKLNPSARAPVLCFVGPPGVGKTSLAQSIARALGRKLERLSLGGLHDEAELRGHRRTYVGAAPGRIIQAVRRAGARDLVLLLDELDKVGRDVRGDPAAALLEILDPAHNHTFRDNYLEVPFDLSQVFFLATANALEPIPRALLDRLEVIPLAGYSDEEKLAICRKYLLPRQLREAGLGAEQLRLSDEALRRLVRDYTREAGVRQLERRIARLARKAALRVASGQAPGISVEPETLPVLLGPARAGRETPRAELAPGVAAGLAWTEAGGELLYVEAAVLAEGRGLLLTGQLGEVMKESAHAALGFLWARARALGLDPGHLGRARLHVHIPAGAVPKDGPSAGVTIAAAIASAFTGVPTRADTAMTGEITLTGLVLPVGGVREKLLAARRLQLARVLIPKGNEAALREIPDEVRRALTVVTVTRVEEVLAEALVEPLPRPAQPGRRGLRPIQRGPLPGPLPAFGPAAE